MEMSTPSGEEIYSTPHEEISKPCSSPINAVNRAARALVLWNTHCNHAAAARAALCVLIDVCVCVLACVSCRLPGGRQPCVRACVSSRGVTGGAAGVAGADSRYLICVEARAAQLQSPDRVPCAEAVHGVGQLMVTLSQLRPPFNCPLARARARGGRCAARVCMVRVVPDRGACLHPRC